jgi:glyoxylase-like metal-dependent hydrolase (beta-lactamase superfamily II)
MLAFICAACGTQYPPSQTPPGACPICTEERQFVPALGQSWTTLEGLRSTHSNKFRRLATGLTTIETTPTFGIGQRAILARTPAGNVLWDCIALIDDATVDVLKGLGGVVAIAISHPHYYTTMGEWSRALGGVPIYLHAADRQWVMRADPARHRAWPCSHEVEAVRELGREEIVAHKQRLLHRARRDAR